MKAAKPKKSLAEAMEERLKTLADVRREREAAERSAKDREIEDEVMLMTYGPDWQTRYPGEPDPPRPAESEVRLKAS